MKITRIVGAKQQTGDYSYENQAHDAANLNLNSDEQSACVFPARCDGGWILRWHLVDDMSIDANTDAVEKMERIKHHAPELFQALRMMIWKVQNGGIQGTRDIVFKMAYAAYDNADGTAATIKVFEDKAAKQEHGK